MIKFTFSYKSFTVDLLLIPYQGLLLLKTKDICRYYGWLKLESHKAGFC